MTKNVLIIGGHGKIAQLATPRLVAGGQDVTSLIRNPEQTSDIEALGSTPLVRDLTVLSTEDWAEQLRKFDVVIWTAGAGGGNGASATYAIDRDGALACIDGLEKLKKENGVAPSFIMVSYLGSLDHGIDPEDSFYPYADSKETVDKRLLDSELDYLIIAPAMLTMEPAGGFDVVANDNSGDETLTTSRELVAMVLAELAGRDKLPDAKILPIVDAGGGSSAAELGVAKL